MGNELTFPPRPYIRVEVGDGAVHFIYNPASEYLWKMLHRPEMTHGRFGAMIIESLDYLFCDEISTTEAIRRLRLLRAARAKACLPNAKADLAPASGAQVQRLVGQTEPQETKP